MAAQGPASGRTAQREEPAGSTESSDTVRTSVPIVSTVSPEPPFSPGQGVEPPGKNLWEQICEEYEAELPPFPEGCKVKQEAMISVSPLEETVLHGFNTEHVYSAPHLTMDSHVLCPQVKLETVDPKTCSPKEYLETFIFPVLLPGMASLLHQAKKEKCFERKRTKFIACDFLTEWLYNQNPKRMGVAFTEFFSIPFVDQWLKHQDPGCRNSLPPPSHGRERRAKADACSGKHVFCSHFIGQCKSMAKPTSSAMGKLTPP
ncbi:IQ domain-containing protein K isoform X3 [Mustela erminea]|uniref:IQ domain-containing protein K isoform X3 n=1 Tax=Mustela erminea TaxID=36723 RepID=UPI001386E7AB|nr:IQ domain-containing protein K isoform X3 [Mustela erminea]